MSHLDKDTFIGMRMVRAYKANLKIYPKMGMCVDVALHMLQAARLAEIEYREKAETTRKTEEELYAEAESICGDCFDPDLARVWARALAKQ